MCHGTKKTKVQHQQWDRNCEKITVIVTICADGTSLPPAVLFKGQAFQVKCALQKHHKSNMCNSSCMSTHCGFTSLGYSKKGWTDWEIGIE